MRCFLLLFYRGPLKAFANLVLCVLQKNKNVVGHSSVDQSFAVSDAFIFKPSGLSVVLSRCRVNKDGGKHTWRLDSVLKIRRHVGFSRETNTKGFNERKKRNIANAAGRFGAAMIRSKIFKRKNNK